jgi:hypothetical protein
MYEAGIIPPDARVELIEGQIFGMAPIDLRRERFQRDWNEKTVLKTL